MAMDKKPNRTNKAEEIELEEETKEFDDDEIADRAATEAEKADPDGKRNSP